MGVPFGDLKARYQARKAELDAAVSRVLASGWYVLGKEVETFERRFAAYTGTRHCVGVGNGTDAIEIALRALGIGPGDEVVTVSHTATFTVLGITGAGARPVFVDIDEHTYTLDAQKLGSAVTPRTKAILPVHLYGRPADVGAIRAVAGDIPIIEDAAQAHGARVGAARVGSLATAGCFSFYPSKNLGALGDGGAITTDDDALAGRLRELRNGGQRDRYRHVAAGVNSRLDEIQAAILAAELPHLDEMNERRRAIADRYRRGLAGLSGVRLPPPDTGEKHSVYHLFVVRLRGRDRVRDELASLGIATEIHYPIPAHLQAAFLEGRPSLPATERVVSEILSLPIYPGLSDAAVDEVISALRRVAPAT